MTVQEMLLSAIEDDMYLFIYGLTSEQTLYEGTVGERPCYYDDEAICSFEVVKKEYEGAEVAFLGINIDL